MKVLLCHNNYSVAGGAEVFFHQVGRVLAAAGHKVAFFSTKDGTLDYQWASFFPGRTEYESGSLVKRALTFPKMVYSMESKQAMGHMIKAFQPDIVHVFATHIRLTPSILDACRLAGIPVVASLNDYKHICPNYKLYHHGRICEECKGGHFYRAVVNLCCHDSMIYSVASSVEAYVHNWMNIYRNNVHTFLFASDFMAHKTEEFWGKESFRWRKLRNPFDSTKYKATYNPDGAVLFFGRIIDEKGVNVLVQAASQLPDIPFRIVGDGPDLKNLVQQAESSKLSNVEFAGAKWGDEMDAELKACRFVVVPSIWYENFPYVINQAFAFAKPVVGSNRGGIPELVQHGERGLLYEATDSNALAKALRELNNDATLLAKMGENAKSFSDEEFNDDKFYRTLMSIYFEVLA